MNSITSANSAAGNEGVAGFTTFGNWVGGATGGQHTPVPTSPPTFIHLVGQQGKKRGRSESNDDGYESDSESEAPAKKTRLTYQLERYLSEPLPEEGLAQGMQTILVVIRNVDIIFGETETGSPGSSKTSSSASNSMCGSCVMSGSTGTTGTGTLSDEPLSDQPPTRGLIPVPDDPSFRMNRFLSEPHKDSPILLLAMDWEGEAMRENDPPARDSLESEGMLFLVHIFFFHSSTQAVGKWDYSPLLIRHPAVLCILHFTDPNAIMS